MTPHEIITKLEAMIEDAKTAVLVTTDEQGCPYMRWMTPVLLKGRADSIFTFSRPNARKVSHIKSSPEVEWMFQDRGLAEIINLRGTVTLLDQPGLKAEILENAGSRMTAFWKIDVENTDFMILETTIKEADYYQPMKPYRETIKF